jgi:hypothetical protein
MTSRSIIVKCNTLSLKLYLVVCVHCVLMLMLFSLQSSYQPRESRFDSRFALAKFGDTIFFGFRSAVSIRRAS